MKNTKEFIKKIMQTRGEVRGLILKQDLEYVLKKKGAGGLEKVEKLLEFWGHPIKYKEIRNTNFYPAGLRALTLFAAKEVFDWGDQDIKNLCAYHLKAPLAMRLFMEYFVSLSKVLEKSSAMWSDYWTVGDLKIIEYNKKEKRVILELQDFDLDPIFCCCLSGYLQSITQFTTRSPKVTCREIKCTFRGDDAHRYLLEWE
ncbi:MAG: hypothetical protein ISS87_02165 [Candidatus Pacebacteria bacterium]|nr:hypothetical protein [Candidatus Paceibacterota bacterium]